MYEVSVRSHFSAAHRLAGYRGSCANPHGHNWEVEVFVRGEQLGRIGFLVDFRRLKKAVNAALARLDHADLNKLPVFKGRNPTSENIAAYLHGALSKRFDCARYAVSRVTVRETPQTGATYEASGRGAAAVPRIRRAERGGRRSGSSGAG